MWFLFCASCAVGGLTFAAFILIVGGFVLITVGAALGTMWLCGLSPVLHPVAALSFISIFGLGWFLIRCINERVRYRREVYDWMHWTVRKGWQARAFVWSCCILALWSTVWHANNFERLI